MSSEKKTHDEPQAPVVASSELLAEQIGYHDVDIYDRIESADGRFRVQVVMVNRAERKVGFTSHGEPMMSPEKMFKLNARMMMSMGARYFTANPAVTREPEARRVDELVLSPDSENQNERK